jgi:hypothetical protein
MSETKNIKKGLFTDLNGLQTFLAIIGILGIGSSILSFMFGIFVITGGVVALSKVGNKNTEVVQTQSQNVNTQTDADTSAGTQTETVNTNTDTATNDDTEVTQTVENSKIDIDNVNEIMNQVLSGNESILKNYTPFELRIIRNTIYAEKGYIFQSEDLKNYFEEKSWYQGSISNESQISLTAREKEFINTVKRYE